jgi:hypothetical protein
VEKQFMTFLLSIEWRLSARVRWSDFIAGCENAERAQSEPNPMALP